MERPVVAAALSVALVGISSLGCFFGCGKVEEEGFELVDEPFWSDTDDVTCQWACADAISNNGGLDILSSRRRRVLPNIGGA